jgi:hypothetical protein
MRVLKEFFAEQAVSWSSKIRLEIQRWFQAPLTFHKQI